MINANFTYPHPNITNIHRMETVLRNNCSHIHGLLHTLWEDRSLCFNARKQGPERA
jgi:hypothetical protein